MILIAALTAIMFLGGWLSPLPTTWIPSVPVVGVVLGDGMHWMLFKMCFILFCFLWFRATFPRYRYDQIMRLGWKVFIPVTLVWIFVMGAAMFLTPWGHWFH
jgi:NADH-quinone oxidoreductase subunit H